ncbi:YdcF family protein [Arcticibacter sp. MXS-1]|uniref:YdcF family protein n=1 Tax=Arcticibacter sp. MXS-1 TaxID=3341726 RepID=UPI0035A87DA4
MKIKLFFILLMSLVCSRGMSQFKARPSGAEEWVMAKNYYASFLLLKNQSTYTPVFQRPEIKSILSRRELRLKSRPADLAAGLAALKWNAEEIEQLPVLIAKAIATSKVDDDSLSTRLQQSLKYALPSKDRVQSIAYALKRDFEGMNFTIDVYAGGRKPNYPAIDSISINASKKPYATILQEVVMSLSEQAASLGSSMFSSMYAATRFLEINERWDAALYEPLDEGENKSAYASVKSTDFSKYPYALILVLGAGPDQPNTPLSPLGMITCRKAASQYFAGLAPFILVSGGRAHPYKTKFVEAIEMKHYLSGVLNVPESAILIDPQARHTTTNLRNAARIMFQAGFPANKKSLITSRAFHIASVKNMADRCIKELGYVPYKLGEIIEPRSIEFTPEITSFRIDNDEPLDP